MNSLCFFCFFSAKLVRTITFLSFKIHVGQWYLVGGCMTIRQCVAYCNDLRWTLTFDLKTCVAYQYMMRNMKVEIGTEMGRDVVN
jgi:hypothetical protein